MKATTAGRAVSVRAHYGDFGPPLACEYLEEKNGIAISREKLRQLLTAAGLWEPKPRQARVAAASKLPGGTVAVGHERACMVGGARSRQATNRLFARFVPADSTEQHMRVLWAYLEQYGRPQALYTDRANVFQPTLAPGWREEEPGPKTEKQMGRALQNRLVIGQSGRRSPADQAAAGRGPRAGHGGVPQGRQRLHRAVERPEVADSEIGPWSGTTRINDPARAAPGGNNGSSAQRKARRTRPLRGGDPSAGKAGKASREAVRAAPGAEPLDGQIPGAGHVA
jgi:hypothetical protein